MTAREHKAKSHNGKRRFINQDRAEKAIARMRKAQKLKLPDLTAYQCKFCSKWHIGTLRRNSTMTKPATPKKPEEVTKPPSVPAKQAAPHLRFVEISAALQLIETEAVEYLEDEKEIPDNVLMKVSAYMTASKEHTDEVVRWLSSSRSRIAFLKEEEKRVASIRKLGESMLERVKKYLRKFIDEDTSSSNRLEGNIYHLRTQANSQPRLAFNLEKWKTEIPVKYHQRSVIFTVDCTDAGNDVVDTLKLFGLNCEDAKMSITEPTLDEKAVREALKSGDKVQGAELVPGRHLRDSAPKTDVVKPL